MTRSLGFFLFCYAIVELLAFWGVGKLIGYGWAILLIIGLMVLGMIIAAAETRRIAGIAQDEARNPLMYMGDVSPEEAARQATDSAKRATKMLADLALIFLGSFLLVLPGIVSTVVGFFMILPPVRALIRGAASVALLTKLNRLSSHGLSIMTQRSSDFRNGDFRNGDLRVPPAADNEWIDEEPNEK